MRVTVIGATGVLGTRVVADLQQQGHDVTALARGQSAAERLPQTTRTLIGDVWDQDFLRGATADADAVMMLATAIPRGASMMRLKAWGTNTAIRSVLAPRVARIAADSGVGVLVQESMMFVYADGGRRPVDEDSLVAPMPQATACLVAEQAACEFRTRSGGRSAALRFAAFVTPESEQTAAILAAAERGYGTVLGRLDGYLTFVHVDDAAAAAVHALQVPSGTYNVGAAPVTKSEWLEGLTRLTGRAVRPLPGAVRQALPRMVPMADAVTRSIRLDSSRLASTGWQPRYPSSEEIWAAARRVG